MIIMDSINSVPDLLLSLRRLFESAADTPIAQGMMPPLSAPPPYNTQAIRVRLDRYLGDSHAAHDQAVYAVAGLYEELEGIFGERLVQRALIEAFVSQNYVAQFLPLATYYAEHDGDGRAAP